VIGPGGKIVGRILKPVGARPINLGFFRLLVPRGRGVAHESHGAPPHHGIAAATPRPGLCAGQGATGWRERAVVVATRAVGTLRALRAAAIPARLASTRFA